MTGKIFRPAWCDVWLHELFEISIGGKGFLCSCCWTWNVKMPRPLFERGLFMMLAMISSALSSSKSSSLLQAPDLRHLASFSACVCAGRLNVAPVDLLTKVTHSPSSKSSSLFQAPGPRHLASFSACVCAGRLHVAPVDLFTKVTQPPSDARV